MIIRSLFALGVVNELVAKHGKLSSQLIPLSKEDQFGGLDGVHLFSEVRHRPLENILLAFHLLLCGFQFFYQSHCRSPFSNKICPSLRECLFLPIGQFQFLVEGSSPIVVIPLSKDILLVQCGMHEVSVHGGEERVDDLLEVVVQPRLSLPGVRAHAVLDEV